MLQNDSKRLPRPAGCSCGAYDWRLGLLALLVVAGLVVAGAVTLWRALASDPSPGAGGPATSNDSSCVSSDQTHAAWSAILSRFVHGGRADRARSKSRNQGERDGYLHSHQSISHPPRCAMAELAQSGSVLPGRFSIPHS